MNNLGKWKISSYLAAIFLAGMIAGAFVGFKAGQRMWFKPPRPESMAAHVCDELQRRLNLTPEQAQKIKPIVSDGLIRFQAIIGADISTTLTGFNARIAAELTPEQRVKFAELQREHEKFMGDSFNGAPTNSPKK